MKVIYFSSTLIQNYIDSCPISTKIWMNRATCWGSYAIACCKLFSLVHVFRVYLNKYLKQEWKNNTNKHYILKTKPQNVPYIIVYSYISSESSNFSYSFRILNYQQTLIDYLKKMFTYQIPSQLKKTKKKNQIYFKTKNKIPIK